MSNIVVVVVVVVVVVDGWKRGWGAIRLSGDRIEAMVFATFGDLKVDPRSAVALYKDSFFRGQCLTVRGDVLQLSKTPIGNDAVSSLKLDATCEGPYTGALPAAVFTDSDGRSIEVYGDIPNLKARAFNDSVARILINPGTSLSLYKDKNYTGVCRRMQIPKNGLTITISGPTIASFGREITAIRLGSDPNCARVDL